MGRSNAALMSWERPSHWGIRVGRITAMRGSLAPVLLEEQDAQGCWLGYTPEYIQVTVPNAPACRQGALVNVSLTSLAEGGMAGSIIRD